MIHPKTELKFINDEIGYGIFATEFIPRGTILYIKDQLEIEISQYRFRKLDQVCKDIVEKFSYIDERGMRIVSWDHAKYVNHSCEPNSMSTGYGFEIAIRDIAKNEEITDEYGLFNSPVPIPVNCGCTNCRGILMPDDIDNYYQLWDERVLAAMNDLERVDQPLWMLMDVQTQDDVRLFLTGKSEYRSVLRLKYFRASSRKSSASNRLTKVRAA